MSKILHLKVIPSAKKNLVKETQGVLKVYLTSPPVEGKANEELIDFLAEYLGVKRRQIEIIKGLKSRHKMIKILD